MLAAPRDPEEALRLLTEGRHLAQQAPSPDPTILGENLYNTGILLYDLRRDDQALLALQGAYDLGAQHKNPELIGIAANALGNLYRRRDELAQATERYHDALRAWNTLDRPLLAAVALQNLAYCHLLASRPDDAIPHLTQAVEALQRAPGPDADLLIPHLNELLRTTRANPEAAREKVLEVLGLKATPPGP